MKIDFRLASICRSVCLKMIEYGLKFCIVDHILSEITCYHKSQFFLKRNTYVENVDEKHYFFLKIVDKRLIGETSPLSFESHVINAIILNKRKQELFDKLRDSIFVNSKKGIDYEIF